MKTVEVPSNKPSLLSCSQVARQLGVSERVVRLWAAKGLIPAIRVGQKLWRFDEHLIEAYLAVRSQHA